MDIAQLKSIIDKAMSDYSEFSQIQKYKDTKTAFKQKSDEILNNLASQLPMNRVYYQF
jgi:hypothetical protein